MGKSKKDKAKQEAKSKAVKAPGKARGKENAKADSADNAEVSGMGGEAAAGKEPQSSAEAAKPKRGGKKPAEKIEKEDYKGARKALRRWVKKVVKDNCDKIAARLVNKTEDGDMRSAAMVLALMEKKKKDGEDDSGWDGLSVAEKLTLEPRWNKEMEEEKKAREKEKGLAG
jgi:hypothetical protein